MENTNLRCHYISTKRAKINSPDHSRVSDNEQQWELSHVAVGRGTSTLENNWVESIKQTPTYDTEISLLGTYSIELLIVTEKMFRAALLRMAQTGHSPYVLQ